MHDFKAQTAPLVRLPQNITGIDYIVGDIHGKFSALDNALNKIHFDKRKDRLISVGDLIDRGPESRDVLAWLKQPWFYAILGNHEYMAYRWLSGDPMRSVNIMMHGGLWLLAESTDFHHALRKAIEQLPMVIEVETSDGMVGVVHADCPYDNWARLREANLGLAYLTDQWMSDADTCLWSGARYQQEYTQQIDNIKAVVHGHMTTTKAKKLGNVYFIDTAKPDGSNFTFLEPQKLKLIRT